VALLEPSANRQEREYRLAVRFQSVAISWRERLERADGRDGKRMGFFMKGYLPGFGPCFFDSPLDERDCTGEFITIHYVSDQIHRCY
jgi:hypothetical protein